MTILINKCKHGRKKKKRDFEDLNVVNKEPDQLVDLIISPLSEEPIKSSKEQAVVSKVEKDGQVVETPHIDFIFGEKLLMFKDCNPLVPSQQLKHARAISGANAGFRHLKKPCLHSPSTWMKRLSQACDAPESHIDYREESEWVYM